jgi:hypothetical protein
MDTRHLIDGIVRQTTILIAQLSTAVRIRAPLGSVADQVFLDLTREIESHKIGPKVMADMFGTALRTYQKKVNRLRVGTAAQYARDKLFGPLGMGPVNWWVDGTGSTLTFFCIDTPLRQFAKFGLLMLRNGSWDGKQVVSEKGVEESTTHTGLNPDYISVVNGTIGEPFTSGHLLRSWHGRSTNLDRTEARPGGGSQRFLPEAVADGGYLWKFGIDIEAGNNLFPPMAPGARTYWGNQDETD